MIAWAAVALVLAVVFAPLAAMAPAAADAWRTVTRAFIAAPLTLVGMTILLSML